MKSFALFNIRIKGKSIQCGVYTWQRTVSPKELQPSCRAELHPARRLAMNCYLFWDEVLHCGGIREVVFWWDGIDKCFISSTSSHPMNMWFCGRIWRWGFPLYRLLVTMNEDPVSARLRYLLWPVGGAFALEWVACRFKAGAAFRPVCRAGQLAALWNLYLWTPNRRGMQLSPYQINRSSVFANQPLMFYW